MKGAHIAFFNTPRPPHVHPTLAIVRTLVRRGYRVTYVTSQSFASALYELGAEVVHCPELPLTTTGEEPFVSFAKHTLPIVLSFYERNPTDLIMYDFLSFAGRVVATKLGIPRLQISPAFAFDRRHFAEQMRSNELRQWDQRRNSQIALFLKDHGLDSEFFRFHRDTLNIFLYPKILQLPGDAFDDTCFYAGRCAAERPCTNWTPSWKDGRKIIVISTSTTHVQGSEYYKMCIDAIAPLDYNVILALGNNVDPSKFRSIPRNVAVTQHVPQIALLPHASQLIFLGGPISTAEAVYHGVPLIMITHGRLDPEMYADNNARLGLGVHLRKSDATEENIRAAVVQISRDQAIIDNVKRFQHLVKREAGAEETANRIEEYLESI